MRRSTVLGAFEACVLASFVACNVLTGASDLEVTTCPDCGSPDEAGGGTAEGGVDGATTDGPSLDGPRGDTSVEGPGGFLDTSFGSGGIVDIGTLLPNVHAVAVRPDGRILVAGDANGDLAAVALTPAGVVDAGFGAGGRVIRGLGSSSSGYAVAFDSQGRAIVAGVAVIPAGTITTRFAYAVRIGALQVDPTFGNQSGGGWRSGDGGTEAHGVVTVAGDACVLAVSSGNDHVFARLTSAGQTDAAFGNEGSGVVPDVGSGPIGLVAVSGGFVSGGTGNVANVGQALAVAKISLGGATVGTFGVGSKGASRIGPNNNQNGRAIAVQGDGNIVVAGDYDPDINMVRRLPAVTRFTATGAVDMAYGVAGKTSIDLTDPVVARDTDAQSVAALVDSKGRALAVGSVTDKPLLGGVDRTRTWITRLRPDGSLDPLFGDAGKLLFGAAPARRQAHAAALQPDGKLVVVGTNLEGGRTFVARFVTTTTK